MACFRPGGPAGRAGGTLHQLGEMRRGKCVPCDKSKSCSSLSDDYLGRARLEWLRGGRFRRRTPPASRDIRAVRGDQKKSGTHTTRTGRRAASCHASSGHRRDQGSHDVRGDATGLLCAATCACAVWTLWFSSRGEEGSSSGAYHLICDYGRGGARNPEGR